MVWPALIAAGASLVGGAIAANRGSSGSFQRERDDTLITRTAQDARNAGLHPLFALGATGGYSRSATGFTGSHLGEGVARAGEQIAEGARSARRETTRAAETATRQSLSASTQKMNQAEHELRLQKMQREIALDDVKLMAAASAAKNAEQTALVAPALLPGSQAMRAPEMTTGTEHMRGPYGAYYEIPPGLSTAGAWEELIGESSDYTMGPGIAHQVWAHREKRIKRQRQLLRAAKRNRAQKRNTRRARQSRWNQWFGDN